MAPNLGGRIVRNLSIALTVTAIAGTAFSQAKPGKNTSPKASEQPLDAIPSGLDPTPLVADAFGLLVNLPAGSEVVAERINENLSISVRDPAEPPLWTMRLQMLTSSLARPTAAGQIQEHLDTLKATKADFKVLSNQDVDYGGVPGRLCFIEQNAADEKIAFGWLVLTMSERDFLVFSVNMLPRDLARFRPLLEASFRTISIRSGESVAMERKTRLDAGSALLNSITAQKLREQVGLSQWVRIYQPATDTQPETERGYSCLTVYEGTRDAVDVKNPPDARTGGELGMVVQLRGRVVVDAQRGVYYDSEARYWMAWDQSAEQWSVVGTQRQGEAELTESEIGVRSPATPGTAPRITIKKVDHTTSTSEPHEWDVPEMYLSQTLGWLLPRMLPHDITGPREYGYYFYNFANRVPQISQRTDVWERVKEGADTFRLTTHLTSDSPAVISIYAQNGDLIRRVHGDGSVTEPSAVDELRRVWKAKGLSVSKGGK
jgi:hypothetical protein